MHAPTTGALRHSAPPFEVPLTLFFTLAAALTLAVGPLQGQVHADAVVPVLTSLLEWTPFYWGADRFGMVVPLAAVWIDNPLWNLLFQNICSAFLGLLALFCMARFLFGAGSAFVTGGLAAVAYVTMLSPQELYEYFSLGQSYAPAAGLAGAGLCVFEAQATIRWRWACMLAGSLLLGLGFWVSPSLVLTLAPLIVLRGLLRLRDDTGRKGFPWLRWRTLALLAMVLLCFGSSFAATLQSPFHGEMSLVPTREWWPGMVAVLEHLFQKHMGPVALQAGLALVASGGLLAVLLRGARERRRRVLAAMLCLLAAMCCELLVTGTNSHVRLNDYDGRYLLFSRNLLFLLVAYLALQGWRSLAPAGQGDGQGWRRLAPYGLGILLLGAALLRFGPPSPAAARAAIYKKIAFPTEQVEAAGCTHLAGDYWRVWPLVWRVLLERHERGEPRTLWGVSERAQNTAQHWSAVPWKRMRICGFQDDQSFDYYLRSMGALKTRSHKEGRLTVHEPALPLVYGAMVLQPGRTDELPSLPGAETVVRRFVLDEESGMAVYILPNERIYRYDLVDPRTGRGAAFVDSLDSGVFTPMPEGRQPGIDLEAYGYAAGEGAQ